jgi:hypothetical protein
VELVSPEASPDNAGGSASVGVATEGHAPSPLRLALRKARVEEAERSQVITELRGAETARLEMLRDELRPILADVPRDVDMFDMGIMPSERPRLFIDMIGYVEMGHDRRTYRFAQDTRYGRCLIVESEQIEILVDAVIKYVARRLIEREKALAGDATPKLAADTNPNRRDKPSKTSAKADVPAPAPHVGLLSHSIGFMIEFLGASLLFALLAIGFWTALLFVSAWVSANH